MFYEGEKLFQILVVELDYQYIYQEYRLIALTFDDDGFLQNYAK